MSKKGINIAENQKSKERVKKEPEIGKGRRKFTTGNNVCFLLIVGRWRNYDNEKSAHPPGILFTHLLLLLIRFGA